MTRRSGMWLRSMLIGGALLFGACAADGASSDSVEDTGEVADPTRGGAVVAVSIEGFLFSPDEIVVEAGTTVRWTNGDRIIHTVTAGAPEVPTGEFDGDLAEAGATFEVGFIDPGTYSYFCARHPHMTGTITVTG